MQPTIIQPQQGITELPSSQAIVFNRSSKTIEYFYIECNCSQCDQIEKITPIFQSFNLSIFPTIEYTQFDDIQKPHFAAYSQCSTDVFMRESLKKAYALGWRCYQIGQDHKWIAPEHAQHFGGNQ